MKIQHICCSLCGENHLKDAEKTFHGLVVLHCDNCMTTNYVEMKQFDHID